MFGPKNTMFILKIRLMNIRMTQNLINPNPTYNQKISDQVLGHPYIHQPQNTQIPYFLCIYILIYIKFSGLSPTDPKCYFLKDHKKWYIYST